MPTSDMMKLVLASKALSIWDPKKGPVFWYAAGIPGPFYLNTEQMIGKALADDLLAKITSIVLNEKDLRARSQELSTLILDAYAATPVFQDIIRALVEKIDASFSRGSYDLISGGERRDWPFSIPVAHELGIKHLFLYKDKRTFCDQPIHDHERALHVADLINNAESYFDKWLPILAEAKLAFIGTACVNTRGTNGVTRLRDAGHKMATLNAVELPFFEASVASGFITKATCDELALFFRSPQEWASVYLMEDLALYHVEQLDAKSFERLTSFFTTDPWKLEGKHAGFFEAMRHAIATRKAAAA